jgi:hypothetical protein
MLDRHVPVLRPGAIATPHQRFREVPMTHPPAWDQVSHADVVRAIHEYDQLSPEGFFSQETWASTFRQNGDQRRRRLLLNAA